MRNKMLFRKERILFYTLLAVLFVWALFRISKGVPWKDEAYYAALAKRLLSGQKPFSQVWSLHITSSLLIVPFIKLYEILPRFIGLLLFLRAITVVITFMGAIYINLALKKITNAFLSDGIAFCIAIYMPCGIAALSYNVLGLLFATLTAAACIFCNQEWKWYHALCGGMFFALAVQSYPTAIFLGLPILVFLIAKCKKLKITFFLAFAGAVSVCLAFLWCVLSTVTFPELFSNIQFCLSDPDHVTPLFLQHIKDYLYQFKRWYGLPYMAVCILLTFVGMGNFALRRAKKQKQASSIKTRFEKIFLLSWGITALYGILYTPHTEHITSFKMVPLFLLGPALALFFSNAATASTLFFWLYGFVYSLSIHWATNTYLPLVSTAFVFSTIGTLILLEKIINEKDQKPNRILQFVPHIFMCLIVFQVWYGRAFFDFEIAPKECVAFIQTGIAQGMWSPESEKIRLEQLEQDIENSVCGGKLYVSGRLPMAELIYQGKSVGPPRAGPGLDIERIDEYFGQFPEFLPDCIFIPSEEFQEVELPKGNSILGKYMREKLTKVYHTISGDFYCIE